MRALALATLALVAACGGGPNAARTAPTDPVQDGIERELAEFAGFADRACACADRACTDGLDGELADRFRAAPADWYRQESVLSTEQERRADESLRRLFKCIAKRGSIPYSLGVIALGTFDAIRADICGCADTTCVKRAVTAWEETYAQFSFVSFTDADQKEFDQRLVPEATACFQRGHQMLAEEALLEVKAFRKEMCACQDSACAAEVQAAVDDWAVRHEKTATDEQTSGELEEIGMEIGLCRTAASREEATAAVGEIAAIRDAACACTTPACADEVGARFDAFLKANVDVHGTPEESDQVREHAAAYASCIQAVREE